MAGHHHLRDTDGHHRVRDHPRNRAVPVSVLAVEQLSNVCKSALWERISGWEVVLVVMLIVTAWAVVQVGRFYFMAVVARIGVDPPRNND